MPVKILIAPDKFKGSLSAMDVARAIRKGLMEANTLAECMIVPLADGGEGTSEVLTNFSHGTFQEVVVQDPLKKTVTARYGLSSDGRTAFMELASASGLHLLPIASRNPLHTTTFGTGSLIRHALEHGVRNICMGIGGSATNDAGMGAMTALGVRFYDRTGALLNDCGASLQHIDHIDASGLHGALSEASFTIFCDVDNPLYGPNGAAYVFGPQKGATSEIVSTLDIGLRNYERVLQRSGYSNTEFAGAGAGGGFPVSLAAFSRATVCPGITYIMDFVKLERHVLNADVIITGEGKLDEQTLSGKVVKGVATLASRFSRPVVVVAGSVSLGTNELQALGISRVISLVNEETSTEYAMANAAELIRKRVHDDYPNLPGGQG